MSIREKLIDKIINASPRRLGSDPAGQEEWKLQKQSLRQRWLALTGLEKCLASAAMILLFLVVVQFAWIAALQYELHALSEQARVQRTRIAQLEQSSEKHNNLLYAAGITMKDIEKKWHDLNFRVLQNTWKLDTGHAADNKPDTAPGGNTPSPQT